MQGDSVRELLGRGIRRAAVELGANQLSRNSAIRNKARDILKFVVVFLPILGIGARCAQVAPQ